MNNTIQIVEKPDYLSWDDIKQCLVNAHAENRTKGINVLHYNWTAEQIRDSIGSNGVMFVALDGCKVVGTAAIMEKYGNTWFARGRYAYIGYDGVLPEYCGKGIYKMLSQKREEYARMKGYSVIVLVTQQNNIRLRQIAVKNGYQYVRFFLVSTHDHYDFSMAKWLNGCPYSSIYCRFQFFISRIKAPIKRSGLEFKRFFGFF